MNGRVIEMNEVLLLLILLLLNGCACRVTLPTFVCFVSLLPVLALLHPSPCTIDEVVVC